MARRYFLHFDSDAKEKLELLSDISRIWVDQLGCLTLYGGFMEYIMEYYLGTEYILA